MTGEGPSVARKPPEPSARSEVARRTAGRAADHGAPHVLPLSPQQRGLWFAEQMSAGSAAYAETVAIGISGRCDIAVLRAALGQVVRDHGALRTSLVIGRSGPVQVVHAASTVEVPVEESPCPGAPDALEDLHSLLRLDGMLEPFTLERAPLLRARLYRVSPARAILVLVAHHLVWDGASMDILLTELARAYEAVACGLPAGGEPSSSYETVMLGERARERTGAYQASLDHWAGWWKRVAAAEPQWASRSAPRGAAVASRGGTVLRTVPPRTAERLRSEAVAAGCTMFMVGVACVTAALRAGPAHPPVLLSAPMSVRTDQAAGVIGYLTNTVPVAVMPPENGSGRAFLEEVRRSCVESWTHRAVSSERIAAFTAAGRFAAHSPFAGVLFNHTAVPAPVRVGDGPVWQAHWLPSRDPRCDLLVSWIESGQEVLVRFEYDAERLTSGDAEGFADAVLAVAEVFADGADVPYDALPYFTVAAREDPTPGPEPSGTAPAGAAAVPVPPATRAAARAAWRETLGLDAPDEPADDDDFFSLGGRSLDAARIATRLSAALGRQISIRLILDAQDFGDFLARMASEHAEGASDVR